jgi:hypothetical protein
LGLNQRHPPCHDGALPTELSEHIFLFKGAQFTQQALPSQPELSFCSDLSRNGLESFLKYFRIALSMLPNQILKSPGQYLKILKTFLAAITLAGLTNLDFSLTLKRLG